MSTERLDVRLDQERRRKLQHLAAEQGAPVSQVVRGLIDRAYEETLQARRRRAARELGLLEIGDLPDPATLNRQLELMSPAAFLDASVPTYAASRAHPLKGPCIQVLLLAAEHPQAFVTDAEVLQELLHRYLALRLWTQGRHASNGSQSWCKAVWKQSKQGMWSLPPG